MIRTRPDTSVSGLPRLLASSLAAAVLGALALAPAAGAAEPLHPKPRVVDLRGIYYPAGQANGRQRVRAVIVTRFPRTDVGELRRGAKGATRLRAQARLELSSGGRRIAAARSSDGLPAAIRSRSLLFAHVLKFSRTESAAILRQAGSATGREGDAGGLRAIAHVTERVRTDGATIGLGEGEQSRSLRLVQRSAEPEVVNGCAIRSGAKCSFLDLSGAALPGAHLRGADFRGADLSAANLRRADLAEANLTDANLRGANLRNADLTRVELTGANLTRADLTGAVFGAANCAGTSCTPHIDAVAGALRDRNPDTEGKVWGISQGNTLPAGWLLQTPNCWGKANCGKGPLPPSAKAITDRITQMISGAQKSVDFSGLWPPPDGPFRDAIVAGLKKAVAAGYTPTLRVILGTPPTQYSDRDFDKWFNGLIADVGTKLPVQAAAMSTYRQAFVATSWNHSKVIDVDGRSAIVGGMNYWAGDYLQVTDPVDDVSMTVDGPAAADATRFEDVLWGWICDHKGSSTYVAMRTSNVSGCVSQAATLTPSATGDVPILTVGRLGNGIEVPGEAGRQSPPIPKSLVNGSACIGSSTESDTNTNREYEYRNPGETALRALIASADKSVFLSQQDLLGCVKNVEALFDERVFAALGEQVANGVPITIVVSDEGAKSQSGSYSNGYKLKDIAQTLTKVVAAQNPGKDARQMVCKDVGLAGVRTVKGADKWANGNPFANHAKLVAVDDSAFYIGSENLYPARLQELGMIVEDAGAAATLKSSFLDPMWSQSRAGALIDPGKGICGQF
jgi:hypothetical protein